MTPSEPTPAWSPLAAFGISLALLIVQLALATGIAVVGHRLTSEAPAPVGPATIAGAAIVASCIVAVMAAYVIAARADRIEVLGAPRGGLMTLVLVPLAFAAAAYAYQLIRAAVAGPPAASPGRPVTSGEVTLLAEGPWLLIASAVVVAPVVEELIFRGLMLPGLTRSRLRFLGATVVTSVLFTLWHPGGAQKFASFSALLDWHLLMALGLCLTWWLTRSVWPCVLGHAASNLVLILVALGLLAQRLP